MHPAPEGAGDEKNISNRDFWRHFDKGERNYTGVIECTVWDLEVSQLGAVIRDRFPRDCHVRVVAAGGALLVLGERRDHLALVQWDHGVALAFWLLPAKYRKILFNTFIAHLLHIYCTLLKHFISLSNVFNISRYLMEEHTWELKPPHEKEITLRRFQVPGMTVAPLRRYDCGTPKKV